MSAFPFSKDELKEIAQGTIHGKYNEFVRPLLHERVKSKKAKAYNYLMSKVKIKRSTYKGKWPDFLRLDFWPTRPSGLPDAYWYYCSCTSQKEMQNVGKYKIDIGEYGDKCLNDAIRESAYDINCQSEIMTNQDSLLVCRMYAEIVNSIDGSFWAKVGNELEELIWIACMEYFAIPSHCWKSKFINSKKRKIDAALLDGNGRWKQVGIKLNGCGNPESLDSAGSRKTDLMISAHVSKQQKRWSIDDGKQFLELDHDFLTNFMDLLVRWGVPHCRNTTECLMPA